MQNLTIAVGGLRVQNSIVEGWRGRNFIKELPMRILLIMATAIKHLSTPPSPSSSHQAPTGSQSSSPCPWRRRHHQHWDSDAAIVGSVADCLLRGSSFVVV